MPEPNEELLDEAIMAMEDEDYARAEALIQRHLRAFPRDEGAADLLEQVALLQNPGAPEPRPETAAAILPFRCLTCGSTANLVSRRLLNTRLLTFFGYDSLNADATCITCARCGHVHWFSPASPGALQAMNPRLPTSAVRDDHDGGCLVCGFDACYPGGALVNTRGLSFFRLDFLNRGASLLACGRCGFLHWFMRERDEAGLPVSGARLPPIPPLGDDKAIAARQVSCAACGGKDVEAREGLLNSRGLTHFGLEFLNAGATIAVCNGCGHATWYADETPAST